MDPRVDLYVRLGGYAVVRFEASLLQPPSASVAELKVCRNECSDLITEGLPCFLETSREGRLKGEIESVIRNNGLLNVRLTLGGVKYILEQQGRPP